MSYLTIFEQLAAGRVLKGAIPFTPTGEGEIFRSSRSAKVGGSTGALAQAPAPHWSPPGVSRRGWPAPSGSPQHRETPPLLLAALSPDEEGEGNSFAQDGCPCRPCRNW